jgi:AraC-like DNA-binding protein
MDEKFIKKAREIVEDYMSDSEFDVQKFVTEMGMSRSVLYRKLRAVTNQSANEFINLIRLKRAAQLLEKKTMNVSEISYMVGFNDPQYFSKCFRKQYGKTPSQYASSTV